MRVLKTRGFARFARSERISDADLAAAVRAAERGLVDADLGVKSARANVKPDELADLRDAADEMVAWSDGEIAERLERGALQEVDYE